MTTSFFTRTAEYAVGGALVGILIWAAFQIGPVAISRWF
jgi:hypothetical protein